MTTDHDTATDAARDLNASDLTWRVYLIHRDTFHWTRDFRNTLCGVAFNSRSYTEASSIGTSHVCQTCRGDR
jgi:hypothetical protein